MKTASAQRRFDALRAALIQRLAELRGKMFTVGQLAYEQGVSRQTIGKHLKALRDEGALETGTVNRGNGQDSGLVIRRLRQSSDA